MQERTRIAAICIRAGKLLLVKGADRFSEFWTPGGKLEPNESDIDCLKRELREELCVELVAATFFKEYLSKSPYIDNMMTKSRVYIVEISGDITCGHEIQRHLWMSKEDFRQNRFPLIAVTREEVIPDLIKAGEF